MRWMGSVLLMGVAAAAPAQSLPANSRGELLYTTHCVGCHTTQVHWRDRKLASDWAGLTAQVERWQKNANLGWSGDDIDAVARYLNAAYYRFPRSGEKPVGEGHRPFHIALRD